MKPRIPERQDAVNTEGAERAPAARTAGGDAFSRFAVAVLRLAGQLQLAGDTLARPAGQTSARWRVLAAVEHAPGSVADVARALGLARQSVQRVADLLVADGLAAYADNPAHQRAKLVRLAPPGRSALRAIQEAQRGWADALGAAVAADDLARATAVLERVARLLDAGRAGG